MANRVWPLAAGRQATWQCHVAVPCPGAPRVAPPTDPRVSRPVSRQIGVKNFTQVLEERRTQVEVKLEQEKIDKVKSAHARSQLDVELQRINLIEAAKAEESRQVRLEHQALLKNQQRLVTAREIYHAMRQLALWPAVPEPGGAPSLFDELPVGRSCRDAGVPEEYCACRRETS